MGLRTITANLLRDGRVAFLAEDGHWTRRLDEAALADTDAAAAALEAAAQAAVAANLVVAPYAVAVEHTADGLRPVRYREWLRTQGPSVRTDVGYQAGGADRPARRAVA